MEKLNKTNNMLGTKHASVTPSGTMINQPRNLTPGTGLKRERKCMRTNRIGQGPLLLPHERIVGVNRWYVPLEKGGSGPPLRLNHVGENQQEFHQQEAESSEQCERSAAAASRRSGPECARAVASSHYSRFRQRARESSQSA